MSVARVRSRYRGYSPETLQRILQLIRNRQMTAYIAAKAYAILKTTIVDKVAGRVPVVCRKDLMATVKVILDKQKRNTPFKDNIPGKDWIYGLLKRHPELACAEWLLRCGAEVRWKGSNKFHKDYNSLPPEGLHKFVIEEINADEAALMEIGFPHFVGCHHIKKIKFYHCPYLEDGALVQLGILKDSLEQLEIVCCGVCYCTTYQKLRTKLPVIRN
ncbi:hypothetical protein LSH36_471g02007 [Paralvinella palmiformis]|uniref:Distal membrane arm assembly complex 2-like protein n=1 Tax=Paralvinella palmiformis TaxID=53620 RepID=A0AAD9MX39_9ANNE|nr:hypothetical protein LSH36_471g02007 [Paralvinella palmiformis]